MPEKDLSTWYFKISMGVFECVYMCVCAHAHERERERERPLLYGSNDGRWCMWSEGVANQKDALWLVRKLQF